MPLTDWVEFKPLSVSLSVQTRDYIEALERAVTALEGGVGSAWTPYVPVYTPSGGAPSIGNGSIAGAFRRSCGVVNFWAKYTVGSSTNAGTGTATLSLPVPASAGCVNGTPGLLTFFYVGPSVYPASLFAVITSAPLLTIFNAAGAAEPQIQNYLTGAGTQMTLIGSYEPAEVAV